MLRVGSFEVRFESMDSIPSVAQLTGQNTIVDAARWIRENDEAVAAFKTASMLLKGPVDCIELYRLKNASTETVASLKASLANIFEPKGYKVRVQYTFDAFRAGMDITVQNRQHIFLCCIG